MNENSPKFKEFEEFLISIGGLNNGYFPDRDPITSPYYFSIGEGWYSIVMDLIKESIALGWDKEIHQAKEKYGGLRWYTGGVTKEVQDVIDRAEAQSYKVCEVCGTPGEVRKGGWLQTLCNEHAKEKK